MRAGIFCVMVCQPESVEMPVKGTAVFQKVIFSAARKVKVGARPFRIGQPFRECEEIRLSALFRSVAASTRYS